MFQNQAAPDRKPATQETRTLAAELFWLMRPQQWIKNILLLAPLFFSGKVPDSQSLLHIGIAAAVFSLVSSAIYIFNDWQDVEADRKHTKKMRRPLAAGTVPLPLALLTMVLLIVGALILSELAGLRAAFLIVVVIYIVVNIAYSLGGRELSVIELFFVASGFVMRVVAGGLVLGLELSPWILTATGMIALLLAAGKRRGDLLLNNDPETRRKALSSYNLTYLDSVISSLVSGTIVVYLLYCISDYAHLQHGSFIIVTAIPVTAGLLRYQQVIIVEGGGDSPTEVIAGDRFILLSIISFVMMFSIFIYV